MSCQARELRFRSARPGPISCPLRPWGSLPGPDERTFDSQQAARYGDKGMTADSKRDARSSTAYRVLSKEDYDKAIDQHGMAILLNPPFPSASVGSATAWIDEERNKALADPMGAALTWFNRKEYDKAIAVCAEAISVDPGSASRLCPPRCGLA